MFWHCDPLAPKARPHDPSQAVLEIPWEQGTIDRWIARSWVGTHSLEDHLYAILGKTLENGTLTKLRVCRHCGKYLVAVRGKRREVGRGCKDAYQNQKKTETGYWKKNRDENRERAISQVKRLIAAGKSIAEILNRPILPQRVVQQLFNGRLRHIRTKPKTSTPRSRVIAVETPDIIAARLRPAIADHYKRMAKRESDTA